MTEYQSPDAAVYPERQAPIDRELVYQGPSLWPLSGADQLLVTTAGSAVNTAVTISLRTLNQQGTVQRQIFQVLPFSNRTVQTFAFPVGDGFLLDVTARATAGAPLVGQLWVVLELIVGASGEKQKVTTLAAGYVTPQAPLFGPASNYETSLDTEGAVRSIQVTTPGAGADWSQTVPTGARWLVTALFSQLVTAVAAGTRSARLIIDDGANILFEVPAPATQAPSLTVAYAYGQGAGGPITADAAFIEAPLPNDCYLAAGFRIRSSTGTIQAADQWSLISLLIREWIEV